VTKAGLPIKGSRLLSFVRFDERSDKITSVTLLREAMSNLPTLKNMFPSDVMSVLAVDDNPTTLKLIAILLERAEYRVVTAQNGVEALQLLEKGDEQFDIIVLDRMMPQMDGIELCYRLKADERFRLIPIIMQTAAGRPQDIREGIEAGVFYYLVKPLVADTLISIVNSAREKARRNRYYKEQARQRQESMAMVVAMTCRYQTIAEGEKLADFIAQFFPEPDAVITGISELFLNAVEHGNLAISYEEKTRLLAASEWDAELARRLSDSRYRDRRVTVCFTRHADNCQLRISDEGEGFDWQQYLEVDLARVTHNHGRGIAMANMMSFDNLSYNNKGNEVTGTVFFK
jgi:CheY-like chemotaxis protein